MKYDEPILDELVGDKKFWAEIRKMEAQYDAEADIQAHKPAKSPRTMKGRPQTWKMAAKTKRRIVW